MVCALIAGTKTQTRRILKPRAGTTIADATVDAGQALGGIARRLEVPVERLRLHYAANDRLWVRENVRADELATGQDGIRYLADEAWLPIENSREAADRWVALNHYGSTAKQPCRGRKVPSIHMPRWASRLTLTVTEVRVERLQGISEADAIAEGVSNGTRPDGSPFWAPPAGFGGTRFVDSARHAFADLWKTIHGPESWAANPWVAAISFGVAYANIDAPPRLTTGGRA
ncbi:hypothetical protein Maq22A_c04685 [Methylobacterium aquaticum]|uniref:LysM domain-containing protein n=2 Tax=Methylobacterium aquaticum TaxID=270351 RepID=A0A0C6F7P3_9HYPH|nr:hypothetical protein Maq22A_c04685 [Methylobacterium aquaticum]